MIGIIVLGHGRFPEGITSALKMFFSDLKNYDYLNFNEGQDLKSYSNVLQDKILVMEKVCDEIIIYADLFGGTPFNQAMVISQNDDKIDVIVPACLPLLMESINIRDQKGITRKDFISKIESGYTNYFINGKKALLK